MFLEEPLAKVGERFWATSLAATFARVRLFFLEDEAMLAEAEVAVLADDQVI